MSGTYVVLGGRSEGTGSLEINWKYVDNFDNLLDACSAVSACICYPIIHLEYHSDDNKIVHVYKDKEIM